jgi:1-pyrroline-5-carboxylate dehydrogenase
VFLRAAALIAGPYRERLVAATMMDQSKTVDEAEADAACELADFFRFNVESARDLLTLQPRSTGIAWNRMNYRALEGFVYAITPFNFTAIGGNLPTLPALMGNVVIWKPSSAATIGASLIMEVLQKAGLPDGVINLVYGDPELVSTVALADHRLSGVHFTGSTNVFRHILATIGSNLGRYRDYPRVVGETGGKGFVVVHESADPEAVVAAIRTGGYSYQGQKCSAASRVYAPASMWPELRDRLVSAIDELVIGDVRDEATDLGAVINERAFRNHEAVIRRAMAGPNTKVVAGGHCDGNSGWFVSPTLIETADPSSEFLRDEFFGPIVTVHVHDGRSWDEVLSLVDTSSPYALTGSIFAEDIGALRSAVAGLEYTAGNLYVNDKPTGAVVGQQPFGGSRASGTNDKSGTPLHVARWVSPRTIKQSSVRGVI